MMIILSPAKTLDFSTQSPIEDYTLPVFSAKADFLAKRVRKLKPKALSELLQVSPKLAQLNIERYASWDISLTESHGKQAVFTYNGEVYNGLQANDLSKEAIYFAQDHLRILSGLYGILRPLDKILPHRLEMASHFATGSGNNLYDYWGSKIARQLIAEMKTANAKTLVNLASQEYYKTVTPFLGKTKVITPVFVENKNGELKVVSIYAKKARGMMSRFVLQYQLNDPEHLKAFDEDGYQYNQEASSATQWMFVREH